MFEVTVGTIITFSACASHSVAVVSFKECDAFESVFSYAEVGLCPSA